MREAKMAPEDEQYPDIETQRRLREDLDRFMQSLSLVEARDIVAGNPLLLGSHVANYLSEAVKRMRQLGEVDTARSCDVWLGMLRTFRELGVQEGYFELAIDALVRSQTPEHHQRVLLENPDLESERATEYIKRRHQESIKVADTGAEGKYQWALSIISASEIKEPGEEDSCMDEVVNTFIREFIQQPNRAAQRTFLEERPDLLQPRRSVIVGAMFQPFIERARARNELVTLRDMLLRQALFERCREAGVAQAFEELTNGVKWERLSRK
jgi:hypothetical protein